MRPPVAVVPAAGRASRFGGGKLLARLAGQPLIHHTIAALLDAGIRRFVVVHALGADWSDAPIVGDDRVTLVINTEPERGMFSSIQAGLAEADGHPIVILPGDMPFVTAATVSTIVEAARLADEPVVAAYGGRWGHPLALPGRLREDLLRMDARRSLRDALVSLGSVPRTVEVDDEGVLKDVDVPGDLPPAKA
jgi:CTP:molybdopterin cytidylyltransferase MocA